MSHEASTGTVARSLMLDLLCETWERIQPDLRERVGGVAYQSWLADVRPLALERSICYLEAANRMACDRIQRLFKPLLEELLTVGIGTTVSVDIAPKPESLLWNALEVSPSQPVVDESNRTAYLVLRSLLEQTREIPSALYYFHGAPGVGKSFLMNWWRNLMPGRVRIHDGLALRKAFQLKVRDRRLDELRDELLCDQPLVIDGVHRFSNYSRAQRELATILKRRVELSALTVLTARWHPRETWGLDPGLSSFMLSGFVTEIRAPGHVARLHYLRALEGSASRNGRSQAVESMARDIRGTYRDLQHAWTVERNGLRHHGQTYFKLIDPSREFNRLRDRVSERLGIPVEELIGRSQSRRITLARQMLIWLAVRAGLSQAEIGRYMNHRSRAAISYCIKTIKKRMAESSEVRHTVEGLL